MIVIAAPQNRTSDIDPPMMRGWSHKKIGRPERCSMDGRPPSRKGWSLCIPHRRRAVARSTYACGLRARRTGMPMMRMAAPAQRISSFILKLPFTARPAHVDLNRNYRGSIAGPRRPAPIESRISPCITHVDRKIAIGKMSSIRDGNPGWRFIKKRAPVSGALSLRRYHWKIRRTRTAHPVRAGLR